ncbi:MAG: hypothetical protein PHN55_12565 [Dysgonamonadaceae bacterium]|nr:hypothetical protein [Dysgonamonadaceae bacterium]
MNDRLKGFLGLSLLFGVLLTLLGTTQLIENSKPYTAPIYISQEFTITGYSSYTVSGQIANLTSSDIIIEQIIVSLSGSSGNTKYRASWSRSNINIPAGGKLNLSESGLEYTPSGFGTPSGQLKNAKVSKCIINGIDYDLKYSFNGTDFNEQGANIETSILMMIGGIILLSISAGIIIYWIKNKLVERRRFQPINNANSTTSTSKQIPVAKNKNMSEENDKEDENIIIARKNLKE